MTAAVVYRPNSIESFNGYDFAANITEGRPVVAKYKFNSSASGYSGVRQGVFVNSLRAKTLIAQAKGLRHRHIWRLWGLRAPAKSVVDSTVSIIMFCPSDLLLDGYSIENYGNGTIVMMKRSANFMTTINIGKGALSYAKLSTADHKVVSSGKCIIEKNAVADLLKVL